MDDIQSKSFHDNKVIPDNRQSKANKHAGIDEE